VTRKAPHEIDPRHDERRALLRAIGAVLLGLGVVLTAIGLISFFSSFGTFQPPRYFWAAFLGLPLIVVGLAIIRLGYLGAFFRYFSGEVTPVARDTFNAMAEGAQPGVETVAHAVGRGLAAGFGATAPAGEATIRCASCGAPNPSSAQFCNQCGTTLQRSACPNCGAGVPAGAQVCVHCGKAIG
jgi:ribosomal protein L40E